MFPLYVKLRILTLSIITGKKIAPSLLLLAARFALAPGAFPFRPHSQDEAYRKQNEPRGDSERKVRSQQAPLNHKYVYGLNIVFIENSDLDVSVLRKYICPIQTRVVAELLSTMRK